MNFSIDTPPHASRGRQRLWRGGAAVLVLLLAGYWLRPDGETPEPAGVAARAAIAIGGQAIRATQSVAAAGATAAVPTADPPVALSGLTSHEIERRMVGRWVSEYHGRMTVDKRPDRTADLQIEFNLLASLLYGGRLDLRLEWHVEGETLVHTIVSGTPTSAADRLIRDYGRTCEYRILELTPDRIRLQELADPDEVHVWTRLSGP